MTSLLDDVDFDGVELDIDVPTKEQMRTRHIELQSKSANLCKFFQKGTCLKGNKCPFNHSRGEKQVVCKHWMRALCKKNDDCEFLHEYDISRMPECQFFRDYGKCARPDCLFLHVAPEDRMKDCSWYDRGVCKHGPSCRNRHVRRKACPDYLAGFCIKGPDCEFGHPKLELPMESGVKNRMPVIFSPEGGKAVKQFNDQNSNFNSGFDSKPFRPLHTVTCFKCGEQGHYANRCTNQKRAPPEGGWLAARQNSADNQGPPGSDGSGGGGPSEPPKNVGQGAAPSNFQMWQ
mmetsp:Transcript_10623/g.20147  ORF Transcript_10623/g.20147 Transcript_10623/m.20147 type:complete len:289 (-) Transcript_10623:88-954(-)